MLNKSYGKDTFDLHEIDLHNGIEHDASLFRKWLLPLFNSCVSNNLTSGLDRALQPDQSVKHEPFIKELLEAATGKDKNGNDILTKKDISRILGKRRAVARAVNAEFSLSFPHRIFSSSKCVPVFLLFLCTL